MKLYLPKKLVALLDENSAHLTSLRATIVLLFLALVMALYALSQAPKEILIRIPPDLSNGAVMRVGDVPKSRVLTDTAYLWIEVNTWLKDGQVDAFENLEIYQHYLGDRFKRELAAQYNKLNASGELNRKRRITLQPGTILDYDNRVIVKVKNKAWIVLIDIIVEEFYMGEPVQNVTVRYPLEVEAVETNANQNPLGIKIIGLADQAMIVESHQ